MANNTSSMILGGAILFVGYELMKHFQKEGGQEARNMKMKIDGIHIENDGSMNVDMLIQNPNSQDFDIKSVVGDLIINRTPVASIQMFGDYNVRANSEETIPLNAKVASNQVFANLQKYFKTGKVAIAFQGTFNVNNKAVPISLSYSK